MNTQSAVVAVVALIFGIFIALAAAKRDARQVERLKKELEALKQRNTIKENSDELADQVDSVRTGDVSSDVVSNDPLPDKWLRD